MNANSLPKFVTNNLRQRNIVRGNQALKRDNAGHGEATINIVTTVAWLHELHRAIVVTSIVLFPCALLRKQVHVIYRKYFGCKNETENFHWKSFDIFLIFAQNIDCGYRLEPPRRGAFGKFEQLSANLHNIHIKTKRNIHILTSTYPL